MGGQIAFGAFGNLLDGGVGSAQLAFQVGTANERDSRPS